MDILTLIFGSVILVLVIGFLISFCKGLINEYKELHK